MAWNAGLVGVAGYMVKRWMDKQEKAIDQRDRDLNHNLGGIYEQMRIANGRTAANEGNIQTIKALCAERHDK